jgi:hypothetical protein
MLSTISLMERPVLPVNAGEYDAVGCCVPDRSQKHNQRNQQDHDEKQSCRFVDSADCLFELRGLDSSLFLLDYYCVDGCDVLENLQRSWLLSSPQQSETQ